MEAEGIGAVSLYDDLGVVPSATAAQINAAYRRLSKTYHPDAGGDPDAFARISHAAEILRDPEKRVRYDTIGLEDFRETNPDTQAIELLCGQFGQALHAFVDGKMPSTEKLLDWVCGEFSKRLVGQRVERREALHAWRRNQDARKRLTFKGEGPDFLRTVLDQQRDAIVKSISEMKGIERLLKRAIELADGYAWQADVPPPPPPKTADIHGMFQRNTYANSQSFIGFL